MGNKTVKGLKAEIERPRLFGDAGAADSLRGVCYERSGRREVVVTVGETMLDVYNAESGDRKKRVKTGDIVTATAASLRTSLGPIIALGTETGRLIVHELETLSIRKFEMVPSPAEASGALGKGSGAIDRADSSARRTSASNSRSGRVAVTSLYISGKNAIFVGLSSGVVKMYLLNEDSKAKMEFRVPAVSMHEGDKSPEEAKEATTNVDLEDAGTSPVVGMAVMKRQFPGNSSAIASLVVAHANGELHWYDATKGNWLQKKNAKQPLAGIIALPKLEVLIGYHSEQNKVTIFDIRAGKGGVWDFTPEHRQVNRQNSKTSAVSFDSSRSMLFMACDDGSIFVRRVSRNEEGNIAIKLHRLCNPSSSAVAPGRVTCMWYDAHDDALFTGDLSGYARLVDNATGIGFAETEEGQEAEAERERRGSRVGLQPVSLR